MTEPKSEWHKGYQEGVDDTESNQEDNRKVITEEARLWIEAELERYKQTIGIYPEKVVSWSEITYALFKARNTKQ